MMYIFVNNLKSIRMFESKVLLLIAGMISGLVFAPFFFTPGLFTFSLLCYQVYISDNWKKAATLGFIFGFGHFLSGMYWISIGITVYIDEFWWAIPFALFGLPIILSLFIAASCAIAYLAKNSAFYQFIFCLCWVFFEWLRSWLFTGLPWNLLGYAFSFSDILIQVSNIVGIYGLSFIVIYIATSLYSLMNRPLSKLAYARRFEGDSKPQSAACLYDAHDSSIESTYKAPAEVEFGKRSIISLELNWYNNGGDEGNRTPDPLRAKQMLYP